MQKLSKKDYHLLQILDSQARIHLTKLSDKVGMSRQLIEYKIKKFHEKKIISGFLPIIDPTALGWEMYRMRIKFNGKTQELKEKLTQYIYDEKFTFATFLYGRYDVALFVLTTSADEYRKKHLKMMHHFSQNIKEVSDIIFSKIYHCSHQGILGGEKNIYYVGNQEKKQFDKLDLSILDHLREDGRASLASMAKAEKTTPKTISNRIEKMQNNGIIKCFRLKLHVSAFGYFHYKVHVFLMNTSVEQYEEFKQYLLNHPKIAYVSESLGEGDIEYLGEALDFSDMYEQMEELKIAFPKQIKDLSWYIHTQKPTINQEQAFSL